MSTEGSCVVMRLWESQGQGQEQERQPSSALRASGSADEVPVKTQISGKATLPLDAPFILSPDSCYWCTVYPDECYWPRGSGNKVSGSVAAQNTTRVNDFILWPVTLDWWESNVRKCVVYLCAFPGELFLDHMEPC